MTGGDRGEATSGVPGAEKCPPRLGGQPDISIVIPCYNAQETVAETIDSIRSQTYRGWEAVCVDDESTDSTPELLGRFADADPRIQFHRVSHGGLAATRNRGWPHTRADRVMFLDADDLLRPDALAMLLRASSAAGEAAIVAAACELITHRGRPLSIVQHPGMPQFSVDVLVRGNRLPPMTLIPRSALPARPYDETLRACEDWNLWLRMAYVGIRCVTLPRVLFGYRLRAGSLSHRADLMFTSGRRVIERWLPKTRDPGAARDALHRLACTYGAVAFASGRPDALQRYFAALPPLEPADGFDRDVGGAIYAAFTHVHGVGGHTWRENRDLWLSQIETWLARGPLAAHAEAVFEHVAYLARMRRTGPQCAAAVRDLATRRPDASRVLVYGLGWNGVALLEELRADQGLRPYKLCVADDYAGPLVFSTLGLPREDPRRWTSWPADTIAVVTPNDYAAMEATLQRCGGRPGLDFISLTEHAPTRVQAPEVEAPVTVGGPAK